MPKLSVLIKITCTALVLILLSFFILFIWGIKQDDSENADNQSSPSVKVKKLAALASNADGVDNSWALWLINSKNPHPSDYVPELASIGSYMGQNREFDSRAADYALLLMEAAGNDGVTLSLLSSYRQIVRQEENFRNWFNGLIDQGYSRNEAFDMTTSVIAIPRTSEHNAGLAIDFNSDSESFDRTSEFAWLRDNAHKFGFILRYPKGKTDVTGIIYEPWHWRFVGLYHAEKIHNSGLALEEYIGSCADDDSAVNAFKQQYVPNAE